MYFSWCKHANYWINVTDKTQTYTPYMNLITDDLGKTCIMYVFSIQVNILNILACVCMHTDVCTVNMSLSDLGVRGFDKTYVSFQRFCFELDQSNRVFFFMTVYKFRLSSRNSFQKHKADLISSCRIQYLFPKGWTTPGSCM